jgi:hypothetical protein
MPYPSTSRSLTYGRLVTSGLPDALLRASPPRHEAQILTIHNVQQLRLRDQGSTVPSVGSLGRKRDRTGTSTSPARATPPTVWATCRGRSSYQRGMSQLRHLPGSQEPWRSPARVSGRHFSPGTAAGRRRASPESRPPPSAEVLWRPFESRAPPRDHRSGPGRLGGGSGRRWPPTHRLQGSFGAVASGSFDG